LKGLKKMANTIASKELLRRLNENAPAAIESIRDRLRKHPELQKNFRDSNGKLPAWLECLDEEKAEGK
jgi:hypothetical protein